MRKAASAAVVAVLFLQAFAAGPVAATDTGAVTQITTGNNKSTVPVIAGNGTDLVFHSSATDIPGATQTNPNIDDIYQADLSTDPVGYVARSDGDTGERASFPDISANGLWAVFSRETASDGTSQIWRVNLTTGARTQLTSGNADSGQRDNVAGARIDNSGNVVFQSLATDLTGTDPDDTTDDGQYDIYYSNGSTITKLTGDADMHYLNPDISADGTVVAYNGSSAVPATSGNALDVYTNTTDGTSEANRTTSGNGRHNMPKLSDDGSTMVFRSDSTNLDGGNNTFNAFVWTSGGIDRLTNLTVAVTNPAISGDGAYIAYASASEIHRTRVSDGSTIQISDNSAPGPIDYASVNDDGSIIAFAMSTDGTVAGVQIHVWDAAGVVATAPDAPTGVSATATSTTSATVSFVAPAANGSPITNYTVTSSPGGVTAAGASSPIVVSGLAPDTTYTFTVVATNGVGDGPAGGPSAAITTPPVPEPEPDPCGPILNSTYQGTSGVDARIARLYAAYFLRNPDQGGFDFWKVKISAGQWTNNNAATFFGTSPEFNALYGSNLTNTQFLTVLYENALCRAPDAGGLAFWLGRMNDQGWSRGQVALGFSDAPEFRDRTNTL